MSNYEPARFLDITLIANFSPFLLDIWPNESNESLSMGTTIRPLVYTKYTSDDWTGSLQDAIRYVLFDVVFIVFKQQL